MFTVRWELRRYVSFRRYSGSINRVMAQAVRRGGLGSKPGQSM